MHSSETPRKFYSFIPPSITLLISMFLILIVFFVSLIGNLSFSQDKQKLALWSVQKTFGYQRDKYSALTMIDSAAVKDYATSLEKIFGNDAIIQTSSGGDKITLIVNKDFFYYQDESDIRPTSLPITRQFLGIIRKWSNEEKPKFTITLSVANYELDKKRLQFFRDIMAGIDLDTGLNLDDKNYFVMTVEK